MPEDVTMTHGAVLFLGAFTVMVLRFCAVRVTQSVSIVPLGWLMLGLVTAVVSAVVLYMLGRWSGGGTPTSWAVLAGVWLVCGVVYLLVQFARKPVR